ncbi:MAG: SRPBCC domain-containing protein [Anaerolineae bacterium]|nr:SRPBCC domain-containing protein [Anaerolineae bacterium]
MVVSRQFDAPVEQVWAAWSDPNLIKGWWGPTGFTCPLARIDFREGGTSLVCMRAPAEYGGMELYNTWTYTKIVPNQRIAFLQHFADKDGNRSDPAAHGLPADIPAEVPHLITFEVVIGGKTQLTITEYGYHSEQIVAMSKAGMEQCLDKMQASLGTR